MGGLEATVAMCEGMAEDMVEKSTLTDLEDLLAKTKASLAEVSSQRDSALLSAEDMVEKSTLDDITSLLAETKNSLAKVEGERNSAAGLASFANSAAAAAASRSDSIENELAREVAGSLLSSAAHNVIESDARIGLENMEEYVKEIEGTHERTSMELVDLLERVGGMERERDVLRERISELEGGESSGVRARATRVETS